MVKEQNKFQKVLEEKEEQLKNRVTKLFNWGWFKFSKCIFGIFLYSLAVNLFIVPDNLYTGGTLGLSQLIRTAIVSILNLNINFDISSVIYYLINIPLFLMAYKKMSKTFFARTLFTVTFNSLFLMLIPIPKAPIIDDLLANTVIGGVIAGIGLGMVLSTGSSSGGTDIIGVYFSGRNNLLTVGNIGLGFNVIIYSICGLKYGIMTMIYSIIFAVFETISMDKNHTQNIKSQALIFTKEDPEKMIHFINYELNRGATYWEAVGGYTNTKTYIVCAILSKYERMRLERHMKEFDKNAFMVADDGVSVKGDFGKYLI